MDALDWKVIGILVTLFLAWSGFLVGVIKWLVDKAVNANLNRQEQLEQGLEKLEGKHESLERDFRNHLLELPEKYVQRVDWVRLVSVIEAKMDKLNDKLDKLKDDLNGGHRS